MTPISSRAARRAARASTTSRRDPARACRRPRAENPGAQQDRSGEQAGAAGAGQAPTSGRVRGDLHGLGAVRRRRRRPQRRCSPRMCRQGRGFIRRTRCRTRRCAIWRPRSPAKRSICGCTRNCRTSRRSRPRSGRSSRTVRSASSRPSMSSAKASARSCSARAARPSRRSARRRATRSPRSIEQPVHLFLFVKVREGWGEDPDRYREMGLEFPKE